jgi:hypothetical protein
LPCRLLWVRRSYADGTGTIVYAVMLLERFKLNCNRYEPPHDARAHWNEGQRREKTESSRMERRRSGGRNAVESRAERERLRSSPKGDPEGESKLIIPGGRSRGGNGRSPVKVRGPSTTLRPARRLTTRDSTPLGDDRVFIPAAWPLPPPTRVSWPRGADGLVATV